MDTQLVNQLTAVKNEIDKKLTAYLKTDNQLLAGLKESINYSLFSGGKRIRPIFCILVGELFNIVADKLFSIACALEMVHTSSLILDDLPSMDNAQMRRGKPANHLVFGSEVAVLASISLMMRAFEIIEDDRTMPDDKKVEIVKLFSKTIGMSGMSGGQYVDLKFSAKDMEPTVLDYIHQYKTASLFSLAGASAAVLGGATNKQLKAVEDYALNLGMAFQIFDDILDLQGRTEETGKSLLRDKGSFVKLYGLERSQELAEKYTEKAFKSLNIFKYQNQHLILFGKLLLNRRA